MIAKTILLAVMGALITCYGSAHDGLSLRKENVGWLAWHKFGWLRRDVPMVLVCALLVMVDCWNAILTGVLLLVHSLHPVIMRHIVRNIHDYWGDAKPPAWWLRLRKLWTWLPWY